MGRNDPMLARVNRKSRRLVWLHDHEAASLQASIANALDTPHHYETLSGVHDELAVARERHENSSIPHQNLAVALGKLKTDLPVWLSIPEMSEIITLENVDENIKNTLVKCL
jgi:hypothetical protein